MCKENCVLPGIEFVNFTPCSESDVVYLYKTRVNKIKEKTIIDEGILDKKYTPHEVMLMLLLRLSQRFTLEESKYLESHHQAPLVDIHQDGAEGKWHSIISCQKLIKAWKKNRTKDFPIMSDDELKQLEKVSDCIKDDMNNLDEKAFYLFYTPQTVTTLPFLVGCLKVHKVGDLQYFPCIFTIDSAASSSILPLKLFKRLGHKLEELDKSQSITVATACSNSTKALGFFESRIYLRGQNKRFYWLPVRFLVLDCALEDRVLVGIRDLRAAGQKLDSSGSVETITLSVKNHNDEEVRKKFITNEHLRPGKLSLIHTDRDFKKGKNDILYTSDIYIVDENKSYRTSCKGGKVNGISLKSSEVKVSKFGKCPYPESLSYTYTVRVKSCSRRKIEYIHYSNTDDQGEGDGSGGSQEESHERDHPIPREHYGHPAEKPLTCLDPIEDLTISPDLEGMTIDQMTMGPPDIEVREDKWYLPEMSHLKPYWQSKYENLFFMFKDVMAKSKYDFCQSNLPPVDIKLKPGVVPQRDACDNPRRYGPWELDIIDHYLANLTAAGHIRALRPDERSPFNHNLLLVYRQIPGQKAFVSSKADKAALSHAERIEMLSKSCRLCSDLKSLNHCVEPEGAMVLQKFSESLPLFANKVLSSADVKSGFNVILLSEKSQLYTAFTHRDKQYCYVTLPQGLVTSPPLFQRRLGLALNAENYSLFKQEVNGMLERKEDHPLLIYDCSDGWRGDQTSSNIMESSSELVQQDKGLDEYVYTPVLECAYSSAVQIYMDDLLLMAINQLNDYYTVWFILKFLDKHKIKLAASKFQLSPDTVTYLGYQIDTNESSYGLTVERRKNFKEWRLPTTREILTSRLCSLNYFQSVVGCFKILTQCLHALVNSERGTFHVQKVHRDEWEMVLLMIDTDLTYRIVDLSQPIILQCDASYSSSSGAAFQFLPPAQRNNPSRNSVIDPGKTENDDLPGRTDVGLQIIGQFSKRFAKSDVQKNPLYKEVLGLLACVREFEVYIRNTTAFTVLFTDASSMSFIVKQRHVNSRLANVALYLSSFPGLSVLWTAGGKMNFFSDFLGKQYCGMAVNEPGAIPAKYLDAVPQLQLPTTLLTPDTLRALLSAPMPNLYLDIPERRKQAKSDLMTPEDFEKLLNQKPIEVQTLQALLFGLNSLPADSLAFQRNDKKGLISNTEFELLRKRMDPGELRKKFEYIMVHSHHVECLDDIKELCRDWTFGLVRIMEEQNNWTRTEPSLYSEARHFLQCNDEEYKSLFLSLVYMYQESSLYNFSFQDVSWSPITWIICGLYFKSQITLRADKGRLMMSTKEMITLRPQEAKVLIVGLCMKTKYSISIDCSLENCIFQPVVDTHYQDIEFRQFLIMNLGDKDLLVSPSDIVGQIIFHLPFGDSCGCEESNNVKFILQNMSIYEGIINPNSNLTVEIFLSASIAGCPPGGQVTWITTQEGCWEDNEFCFLSSEIPQQEREAISSLNPSSKERELALNTEHEIMQRSQSGQFSVNTSQPPMTPEAHNKMVLACLLLTREESVFTPAQFRKLQDTDPYLVNIIKKTEKGEGNSFCLINGVLFYTKDNVSKLCLDPNTLSMIVRQMHTLQRHYNLDSMVQYVSSYFFCRNIKQICKTEQDKCSPCFFNTPCRRIRFTNNPEETHYPKPWEQIDIDLDESFPRSGTHMKYLMLIVDACTGFVVTRAMRRATSEEAVKCLEDVFAHFGPPARCKSDFGPLFRGKEFRQYLSSMNIIHSKVCPGRAKENGRAERNVALYRATLMKILTNEVGNSPKHWYKFLPKCTMLFNSSSLYSRDGTVLSRFNLFFSHLKYTPSWLVHSNDLTTDIREKQVESMERLFKIRNDFRDKYKTKPNPYEENQIVISPIAKEDFPSIDGERGGQPTVMQVFRVLTPLNNSCEVISLLDSSKSVIDLEDLRPCSVEEAENLFNKDLTTLGTFQQGLYRAGNKNGQIFQSLFDKKSPFDPQPADGLSLESEHELAPAPNDENDIPVLPTLEDKDGSEIDKNGSEITLEASDGAEIQNSSEVNPKLPLQFNTRYNLRTRKPVTYAYWSLEEPYTNWVNKNTESLKSVLKTKEKKQNYQVTFAPTINVASYRNASHSVRLEGIEDCKSPQTTDSDFEWKLPLDPTLSVKEVYFLVRTDQNKRLSIKSRT